MLATLELRKHLRRQRQQISAPARTRLNQLINQHFINSKLLLRSSSLASYLATASEVDLTPLLAICETRNISQFLPVVQKNHRLKFHVYHTATQLSLNKYGIFEPVSQQQRQAKFLSTIILPLVGFDTQGNRLGMGGGYYDRALAFSRTSANIKRPLLIGAAYEKQKIDRLPSNHWDIPLDAVITEKCIYKFSKRAKYLL